ncbi:MAG: hypothetical protein E7Z72_00400 [Methanocorpusculum parvum]|nr:hypothetical protein [Methanocorpusculum parvum]
MTKKFAIVLALALIAIVCCAGCILPSGPVDPVDPVDPITPPVDPVVPEEPEDPVVPEEPVDPVVPAEGDFTVTFMMNSAVDSSVYLTVYVDEGESVAEPEVPEKPTAQYIFVKWTTDKENRNAYDFATPVTADLVLYADWDVMGVSSGSHTHNYVEGEKDGKQGLLCSCGSFKPYLVEINGESYTSVDEAITNAEAGETITLVTAPETPINVGDKDVTIEISSDVDATTTPVSLTYAEDTEIKIKADSPEKVEVTITDSDAGTEKKVVFDDTPADGLLVPIAAVDEENQVGDAFTADGLQHLLDMISGSSSGPLAAPAEDAPTEHVQDGWNVLFYEPAPTALGDEPVSEPEWTITLKAIIDEPVEITVPVIIDGNGFAATLKYTKFELIHVLKDGSDNIKVYLNDEIVAFDNDANTADCLVVKSVTHENGYLDIYSLEGLKEFRDAVNSGEDYFSGKTVSLMNNIDLKNEEWTPIGSASAEHGFMGHFDGNNHKISNLKITTLPLDDDGYVYAGLFGVTEGTDKDNQNSIKNLIIENVDISTTGDIVSAAIAYPYYTIVDNIKVCGNIHITGGDYTSGVLAYTRLCVDASNLEVAGNDGSTITGQRTVGGVISDIQMNHGLIAEYSNFCVSGVTISGETCVGGISGIIASQTLNTAKVENVVLNCDDSRVGVVSGSLGGTSTITDITVTNVDGASSNIGGAYDGGKPVEAKIGDTYYSTLQGTIAAAEPGKTITLLNDVILDETLTISAGKEITLDLNGNDLSYAVSNTGASAIINNKGTLTITGKGTISFVAENPDMQAIPAYATNTITNTGTLTIGEDVIVTNGSDGGASYAVDVQSGTFTLDGGTLIGNRCALRVALYSGDSSAFIMKSGSVQARTPAWIQLPGSDTSVAPKITVTIHDGTFQSTNEKPDEANVMYTYSDGNSHANTKITIKGGSFLGGTVSIGSGYKGDAPALTIDDGTFDHDVLQWLANDESKVLYEANLNQ